MPEYFDTTVAVSAIFPQSARYADASARLKSAKGPCMINHGLAEAYRTLTGRLGLPPKEAAALVSGALLKRLAEVAIDREDVWNAVERTATAGLAGPIIYDALHAQGARKAKCDKVHTYNVAHFKLVGSDLNVI